jgi:hypothetical protein
MSVWIIKIVKMFEVPEVWSARNRLYSELIFLLTLGTQGTFSTPETFI